MRAPSRAKAVKDKCLECSGYSPLNVTLCPVVECPLWRFRIGIDSSKTYIKRVGRALRVHPDTLDLWIENGMSKRDSEKYRTSATLSEQE